MTAPGEPGGAAADLIGHDAAVIHFAAAMTGPRPHHAWLLTGPQGVGKARFALNAGQWLLARQALDPEVRRAAAGGPARALPIDHAVARLVAGGVHPDFRWLDRRDGEKLARSIRLDQIRPLRAQFGLAPSLGQARVVVIDAADDLERGAANALLKMLEEPPAGTVFLLVSHAPGRLLPTIRSRCLALTFAPLGVAELRRVVADHAITEGWDSDRWLALAEAARGAPGTALSMLELDMASLETALERIARTGDPRGEARTELVRALAGKGAEPRYEAFLHRVPAVVAMQARRDGGGPALDIWREVSRLTASAIPQSLPAEQVISEIARLFASLAPPRVDAKR